MTPLNTNPTVIRGSQEGTTFTTNKPIPKEDILYVSYLPNEPIPAIYNDDWNPPTTSYKILHYEAEQNRWVSYDDYGQETQYVIAIITQTSDGEYKLFNDGSLVNFIFKTRAGQIINGTEVYYVAIDEGEGVELSGGELTVKQYTMPLTNFVAGQFSLSINQELIDVNPEDFVITPLFDTSATISLNKVSNGVYQIIYSASQSNTENRVRISYGDKELIEVWTFYEP